MSKTISAFAGVLAVLFLGGCAQPTASGPGTAGAMDQAEEDDRKSGRLWPNLNLHGE